MSKNRSKVLPKLVLKASPPLPPLLFPSKDSAERKWMASLKKEGLIRTIGPRLYASVPESKVSDTVRGNWSQIVSRLFPASLLSHRSALEYRPSPQGEIFLTGTTNREIHYPGLTIKFMRGPLALKSDEDFMNLRASSLPRALLENLSIVRTKERSKNLPIETIEKKIEEILHVKGESELNRIRDEAHAISKQLKWSREFDRLNRIIGAMLGTRPGRTLKSEGARARAANVPFDPVCVEKLDLLFSELRHRPFREIFDSFKAKDHFRHKAFFEAYFSNYIEGTTFEIEEAEAIIFSGQIPAERPKDAHDIQGTYEIVSNRSLAGLVPADWAELNRLLKSRHSQLMGARPEAHPGEFKQKPNRAGSTQFVHPDYVQGTLLRGFELYKNLPPGLARAIYIMFLVAEVHPFTDGNGRIARIMMNAELHAQRLATILIPNVYRDDYLSGLRALSRRNRPLPLIQMLERAQRFSHFEYSPYPKALQYLESHQWFEEPSDAKIVEE